MKRFIINGVNGHMGAVLEEMIKNDPECETVCGIDPFGEKPHDFPVFRSIDECTEGADCLIDFSTAAGVPALLSGCVAKGLPVVLCTTGLSDEALEGVKKASVSIPILRSANMSLGINVIADLLRKAAKVFAPAGFDAEIVETHHNRKLDAPSGTALLLADAVKEGSGKEYEYIYGRSDRREKRGSRELGISSVRGGNVAGIHDVMFLGEDEIITISHQATSRNVFAHGAVEAAKFLS
ncbi:MAG: 4-hydroxy-tetrahydrodipicolinate reductase, partial [Lachnospiraceae bacterium]|nr:4-hydroxy-tetrahydrodipicolinate reductase [Lachnospiraceae bacterium]